LTGTRALDGNGNSLAGGSFVYDRNGTVDNEYLNWCFKPRLGCTQVDGLSLPQGTANGTDNLWKSASTLTSAPGIGAAVAADAAQSLQTPDGSKLFTLCDLPYVGLLSQGKYLPLWGLGGIIIELYLDQASNWCSQYDLWSDGDASAANHTNYQLVPSASNVGPIVQFDDVKLYYDNIIPPADFLEGLKMQINSPDGLSLIFPSVNRHLATIPALVSAATAPQFYQRVRNEVLIADHSRMAQSIFQIFRPQNPIQNRKYKLHNRTSAALASWQLKLNSAYIPQQPLEAVGNTSARVGADGVTLAANANYSLLQVRQYGQFHRELMKALGQQRRPLGSVTPSQYELITDGLNTVSSDVLRRDQRGCFAIGIDLTVSDDVMTGTNLRNATVTGEMFANIERYVHPGATATEVQTFVMKLSQIRMTAAGPIVVD
jgi:hypothetical protein